MEGEGVNQNFSDGGDINVQMDMCSTKDVMSDENDNEALNGSDVEPLSLCI